MASVLEAEFAFTEDDVREWRHEQREKFLHDQASKKGEFVRVRAALKETQEEIKAMDASIKEKDARIKKLDAHIKELDICIKELEALLAEK